MSEPNLSDLRAVETILNAMHPLHSRDQVRVLTWVIEKLDLALDIKVAIKNARPKDRSYIEMAYEQAPHAMDSIGEFVSATAPESMADRVLAAATFLQLHKDDPDHAIITGNEINTSLRNMRVAVPNITDCIYTLVRRTPPHMVHAGRAPNRRDWKGYRVTEPGIDYVYERIVNFGSKNEDAQRRRR
jgi:hypothetical protein